MQEFQNVFGNEITRIHKRIDKNHFRLLEFHYVFYQSRPSGERIISSIILYNIRNVRIYFFDARKP